MRGAGDLPNSPDQSDTFEVTTQSLSAEFDDSSVTDEGSNAETDLDISSDRGTYSVNVTADGLEDEDLFNIFSGDGANFSADAPSRISVDNLDSTSNFYSNGDFRVGLYQPDDEDSDQKIVLVRHQDAEEVVDFDSIDTGDYDFEFNVTDTEASDAQSISVGELDRSASFSESVYSQTAGDIVEMTIELEDTDNAWVQIGSEDSGFVDVLYIEDDDDDNEVTFEVNTRTLGTDVNEEVVYNTEDDIVQSELYGSVASGNTPEYYDEDTDTSLSPDSFKQYLVAIDQIDSSETPFDQLTRPLQPTTYEVAVNGNNNFIVNEDEESELDDEIGLATLDLTQPGVENVQTWTAPANPADETSNVTELLNKVSQDSDIALDDQLVIQAEATGIYGHMVAIDSDGFDALDDGFSASTLSTLDSTTGEGVNIEVEADDATGNQDPTSLDFGANQDVITVLVDQESGQMFIVVDTSEDDSAFSQSVDDDTDFTAEIEYEADDEEQFNFVDPDSGTVGGADGDTTVAAFPYFAAGEDNTESASADFNLADREASFDNVNDNDEVEITNTESATVTGTTNVAPGTEVSIRVQSTSGVSPSFVETSEDFEVSEDGTFEAELDLSAASVNDTATVDFRVEGSSIADSDAVIVEEVDTAAAFTVSDLNPQDVTATVGDSLTVSATVENTGESEATQTVEFRVGGDAVDSQEVTLGGGESTTVEFTGIDTSGLDAGDYEHGVFTNDDSQTATLTLEAADTGDDTGGDDTGGDDTGGDDTGGDDTGGDDTGGDDTGGDDTGSDNGTDDGGSTDGSTPGFGAVVALVALIAAALLATRRND
ncbi:BGTF surface domain-containing protein [Halorubrum ezzemoulense]|uniref:BGTF surface domain-containing protein n=1 Tax=Halorubrum ezzemoulense TaxID=337243 RepID=UPI00232FEFD4|nr:BGTF surface domain-containing protein [Halorubrum ezzemoulense]MDB9235041.1 PGF-CTERM sorting domain-containing protein [Halorubrum ezzemoulense]